MDKNKKLFERAVRRIDRMQLADHHKQTAFLLLQGCDPLNVKPGIISAFKYIKLVTSGNYAKTAGRFYPNNNRFTRSA